MVFNTIFNSISLILQQPVHLSMLSWSSFNQYSAQYSFQATGCFPTTTDSSQRGMNPVAMNIINPWKEYWPSLGSNKRPPVLKCRTKIGMQLFTGLILTFTIRQEQNNTIVTISEKTMLNKKYQSNQPF